MVVVQNQTGDTRMRADFSGFGDLELTLRYKDLNHKTISVHINDTVLWVTRSRIEILDLTDTHITFTAPEYYLKYRGLLNNRSF